jgi:hypothetical protein
MLQLSTRVWCVEVKMRFYNALVLFVFLCIPLSAKTQAVPNQQQLVDKQAECEERVKLAHQNQQGLRLGKKQPTEVWEKAKMAYMTEEEWVLNCVKPK